MFVKSAAEFKAMQAKIHGARKPKMGADMLHPLTNGSQVHGGSPFTTDEVNRGHKVIG